MSKELKIQKMDLPVRSIEQMIDDKQVNFGPKFQRGYVINREIASKMVESVLLGYGLPPIYLFVEIDSSLTVIDGRQRTETLYRFAKNKLVLQGLDFLPHLNGMRIRDLPDEYKSRFVNAPIMFLNHEGSQDIKIDLFKRLNSGSVKLTFQEIRNGVYQGPFATMLNELSQIVFVRNTINSRNLRMKVQENILRFLAMKDLREKKYNIIIKPQWKYLNSFMEINKNTSTEKLVVMQGEFLHALENCHIALGSFAFSMELSKPAFNSPCFESMMIPFSYFSRDQVLESKDKINAAIVDLKQSEIFRDTIFRATGETERIRYRVETVFKILTDIMGEPKGI